MNIVYIDEPFLINKNSKTSLCLGFFDGFHKGHLKLINDAKKENESVSLMTFDISPKAFLKLTNDDSLMSIEDKIKYLENLNIDTLYILKTSNKILGLRKDEFINEILLKINPKKIYVGEDYTFGYKGEGNVNDLIKIFDVKVEPLLEENNKKISTSLIKKILKEEDIVKANNLLGHNHKISGEVIKGNQLGRTINFPTANLKLNFNYTLPKIGVYAGYVIYDNKRYKSIIDISTHPTIKELSSPLVEAHIIDFDLDIYNEVIEVEFSFYLRDAKKFDSLDDLRLQLEYDRNYAKKHLQ